MAASQASPKAPQTQYTILHSAVALWVQGEIVTSDQLDQLGADVERLLDLGAIAPIVETPAEVAVAE